MTPWLQLMRHIWPQLRLETRSQVARAALLRTLIDFQPEH